MYKRQVQLHVLCAVDSEGYLNVLEVADGTLSLGAPIEDYVAQLLSLIHIFVDSWLDSATGRRCATAGWLAGDGVAGADGHS